MEMANSAVVKAEPGDSFDCFSGDLHLDVPVPSIDSQWAEGVKSPSLRSSVSQVESDLRSDVVDPRVLVGDLMSKGVLMDVASQIALNYYRALGTDVAESSISEASVSTVSARSIRYERWRDRMAAFPEEPGYCYLRVIRWSYRPRVMDALGKNPKLLTLVRYLSDRNMDKAAAKRVLMCQSNFGMKGEAVGYHLVEPVDGCTSLGTFYQVFSCLVRQYPSLSTMDVSDDVGPKLSTFPLVGYVGFKCDRGDVRRDTLLDGLLDNTDDQYSVALAERSVPESGFVEHSEVDSSVYDSVTFEADEEFVTEYDLDYWHGQTYVLEPEDQLSHDIRFARYPDSLVGEIAGSQAVSWLSERVDELLCSSDLGQDQNLVTGFVGQNEIRLDYYTILPTVRDQYSDSGYVLLWYRDKHCQVDWGGYYTLLPDLKAGFVVMSAQNFQEFSVRDVTDVVVMHIADLEMVRLVQAVRESGYAYSVLSDYGLYHALFKSLNTSVRGIAAITAFVRAVSVSYDLPIRMLGFPFDMEL